MSLKKLICTYGELRGSKPICKITGYSCEKIIEKLDEEFLKNYKKIVGKKFNYSNICGIAIRDSVINKIPIKVWCNGKYIK